MPPLLDIVLLLPPLLGHVALWTALFNRLHALPLPCRLVSLLDKLFLLMIAVAPAAWLFWIWSRGAGVFSAKSLLTARTPMACYAVVSVGVGLYILTIWLWRRLTSTRPAVLVSNHTEAVNVAQTLDRPPIGSRFVALLNWVPGNQMFELRIQEKTLVVPRLDPALDGLTIAHLSDLHFTGKITADFFKHVVAQTNQLSADLVAVTGDIVDKAHCIQWIPEILGPLQSRLGSYFILGNHDKRIRDVPGLRKTLEDAGLVDLGRQPHEIVHAGQRILLAGNELPWFGPPPRIAPGGTAEDPAGLRILLSHSPDQLVWARRRNFDLMLAGHTHGGQIRFPLVGPVLTPSSYGVKYAAGVFFEPPTLLHVSRGISGLDPIRINCAPELSKLVLRCADPNAWSS